MGMDGSEVEMEKNVGTWRKTQRVWEKGEKRVRRWNRRKEVM